MQTKRIIFLDVLRVFSFSVIILYHFLKDLVIRGLADIPDPDTVMASGSLHLVMLAVGLFFMISGAGLTLRTERRGSLDPAEFYRSRFLQLLVPFYIVYGVYALFRLIRTRGAVFAGIPAWRFAFTLLGMDEYVNMTGLRTFSLGIGEWFLGALVMMYLLFPLLYTCMKRWKLPFFLLATAGYLWLVFTYHSHIPWHMNAAVKLYEFILGMYMAAHREWLKTHVFFFLVLGAPFLGIPAALINTASCACLFMIGILLEDGLFSRIPEDWAAVLQTISGYSYYVFLVHHVIIYTFDNALAGRIILGKKLMLLLFLVEVLCMAACAMGLEKICGRIRKAAGRLTAKG